MPPLAMLRRAVPIKWLPLMSRERVFIMKILAPNGVRAVLLDEGEAPHVTPAAFLRKRLLPDDVRAALSQEGLLLDDRQAAFLKDMVDS